MEDNILRLRKALFKANMEFDVGFAIQKVLDSGLTEKQLKHLDKIHKLHQLAIEEVDRENPDLSKIKKIINQMGNIFIKKYKLE